MRSWPAPAIPALPTGTAVLRLRNVEGTLVAIEPHQVARLYVCGITPYDATHLGHAATYLTFDILVRFWLDQGLRVEYVQNVTDIDDPLLERAARDGQDWVAVAERETELFREDMTALRVVPPTWYVGAVETMEEVAAAVGQLLDAGAAYRLAGEFGDDIYFSVASSEHFGEVARLDVATMTALTAERGGDPERPGKKDPLDCLLWLAARPGEPAWDSPLGRGRPGWHIECAAIALNRLGPTLDVQGGGSDLAFPHHELSAAEAGVLTGTWPFARAYVHAGMIGLGGEKMSKSRGNLVFVSGLRAAGVDPAALRLALLAGHYRQDRAWTHDCLVEAQDRLGNWRVGLDRAAGPDGDQLLAKVRAALGADLDTPAALAAVDAWCASEGRDAEAPQLVRDALDALLGIAVS
ncbi:MAG: cysteine--1-D-myo-inosityl 2-amino-2-deoxy-alpha-D-glucopyranoside ligase [Actinomycetota bacterium]|nr:cysteine--1-D-myo-inosityl 2-amino-2-deoxy-alpha-D-glucopyranoside ligase [Actinomycetota bacterium]